MFWYRNTVSVDRKSFLPTEFASRRSNLFISQVFYFRIKMLNSKLYRRGAIKRKVPYKLVVRYYWKTLIGTCGAWFLYDFVTFPNGIFSATILSEVIPNATIKSTAEWQLLLTSLAIPGVLIGAWLCNRLGRKYTMMLGFSGYLVFGLIVGCAFDQLLNVTPLFVVLYGLMTSSGNLGPGDMLGLLSSECYATAVRGTCYGKFHLVANLYPPLIRKHNAVGGGIPRPCPKHAIPTSVGSAGLHA